MPVILGLLSPLRVVNHALGWIARRLAIAALAGMVAVTLLQIFYRYVLNNALPWPDEAARFLMLWMTGLIAPVAYRHGGFVAIDMLTRFLPRSLSGLLALILLALSLLVLIVGIRLGHSHTMSGCLFDSSSLWLPVELAFAVPVPFTGMSLTLCTSADVALSLSFGWVKLPLAVMYASLLTGFVLLTLVNVELMLRSLATAIGGAERLPELSGEVVSAE